MLLEAIQDCGAAEVIVLPNDPDSVRVAEVAARTAEESGEVRVAVIPSQAQVQGLAAVAVHEPGRTFAQALLHMTAPARQASPCQGTGARRGERGDGDEGVYKRGIWVTAYYKKN